jgi:hypothetical protein
MDLARDQWSVCCSTADCIIGPRRKTKRRAIAWWNTLPRGSAHIETGQLLRKAKAPETGREVKDAAMRPNSELRREREVV